MKRDPMLLVLIQEDDEERAGDPPGLAERSQRRRLLNLREALRPRMGLLRQSDGCPALQTFFGGLLDAFQKGEAEAYV